MTAATARLNARGDRPSVYYGAGSYNGQVATTAELNTLPCMLKRSCCEAPAGVGRAGQPVSSTRSQQGNRPVEQRGASAPSTVTLQPGSARSTTAPGKQP